MLIANHVLLKLVVEVVGLRWTLGIGDKYTVRE